MKHHIVVYGAYYYAELVGSEQSLYSSVLILQYRTRAGDLFVPSTYVYTFHTRLEAYRFMFFNIRDLTNYWRHRRICYPYSKLTRIMRKLYPEDFI